MVMVLVLVNLSCGSAHFTGLKIYGSISVESIMLSIISMLSSPNDESPANVEAAKEWRDNRDEFKKKVSRCVRRSQEMT
ncbi:hypothetical protein H5410_029200 [Solanum commersonii]|uniref:UBC core domain-containing protein n=1 Tax=Solanum commersonii TaxID=4109 RepID=A0A9J5Z8B4_SOLCO|nr:hypothetical protein H5410_029200 [Solanum commersonii]